MTTAETKTRPAKSPRPRLLSRLVEIGQVLIPGTYAWAVTVVPVTTGRDVSFAPRAAAFFAFASLVAGTFLVKERPRLGHLLGIWAFLALSVITWLSNPGALAIDRLEPVRALAGGMGWLLFALGWGTPWKAGMHPEDNPSAQLHPKLEPRSPPMLRMPLIVGASAVGAFACLFLAWRATEPGRALMIHGVALAAAVAVVTAGSSVALAQVKRRTAYTSKQRFGFALPWVFALVALTIIGLGWQLAK